MYVNSGPGAIEGATLVPPGRASILPARINFRRIIEVEYISSFGY